MTGFYSQKGQKDMRGARTLPKTFLSSNREIAIAIIIHQIKVTVPSSLMLFEIFNT